MDLFLFIHFVLFLFVSFDKGRRVQFMTLEFSLKLFFELVAKIVSFTLRYSLFSVLVHMFESPSLINTSSGAVNDNLLPFEF
jgi:hypothetical protein